MLAKAGIYCIKFYQRYVRPVLPVGCRFEPTCSEYARLALCKYGFTKGIFLAGKRLMQCHPFSGKSGHDPLI